MTRSVFALLGYLMMAGAFVTVVVDGTRSIASSRLVLTSLRMALDMAWPGLVPALRASLSQLQPLLWDPVGVTLLGLPLALVLAVPGLAMVIAARPREPGVGYDTRS